MTRPQNKPISRTDKFIRKHATLLADMLSFTPGIIGFLLYIGGAEYIQNTSIPGGLVIISCGLALMQVAGKIWNYFYN